MDLSISTKIKTEPEDNNFFHRNEPEDNFFHKNDMPESVKEDSCASRDDYYTHQEEVNMRGYCSEENPQSSKPSSSDTADWSMTVNNENNDGERSLVDPPLEMKVEINLEQSPFLQQQNGGDTWNATFTSETAQPHNLCLPVRPLSVTDQNHVNITIKQEPFDECEELMDDKPWASSSGARKLRIKLADIKTEPDDVPSSPSTSFKETSNGVDFWPTKVESEHYKRAEEDLESPPLHFQTNPTLNRLVTEHLQRAGNVCAKLYQCGACMESYENPAQLKLHLMRHNVSSSERPIRCGACFKKFRYLSDLTQHVVVHTGERNHQCEICHSTFTKASSLKGHMKIHTGERPHKCSQCPSSFKHASHLKEHLRTHSGEKPYQCDICQLRFTSSSYLKLHRKIHSGERRFKCDQCSVEFNQLLHLEIHKRSHTGEKPFQCSFCSLRYRYKSSLKTHVFKVHSTEKPHKCERCGAAFHTEDSLAKHEKSHERTKKTFTCRDCSSTFLSSVSLTHHKWFHAGEKPFKCEFCPAAFRDHTSFKRHKTIHVGNRAFKCEHCNASFRLMSHLSCHMKIHCEQQQHSHLPDNSAHSAELHVAQLDKGGDVLP